MRLENKTAFITGAGSGLGFATAQRFIAQGAKVMIFDLNPDTAKAAAEKLGENASFAAGDVTNEEQVASAIDKTIDTFGALHVNVNCAGVGTAGRTVGRDGPMPLERFEKIIRTNLIGTFNVLRLCAARMQENEAATEDGERGVIVNVASVAAFDGQIGQAAYSASKGGIASMTLPIARDLSKSGIRVMTIAPGIFETPMMAGMPAEVRDPLIAMTQFPARLGEPEEFAQLAGYIVECGYLNGETIRLDAGIRMQPK
ncbi:3-hydroxyacyl-CoA dehydrogenase [Gilvimarinus sp. F26214L]|uniref:3-hydroxyacyl-CoA dehydrogenase n=1 Tax=Gilvimarinus sp. DZF01 TaxID=3461371 RepID=UPI0040459E50